MTSTKTQAQYTQIGSFYPELIERPCQRKHSGPGTPLKVFIR
jgi:hypothetical protein